MSRLSPVSSPVTEGDLDAIMVEKWFMFLAVRLCAVKEVAYKALYPLYKPMWKDLTVSKTPGSGAR